MQKIDFPSIFFNILKKEIQIFHDSFRLSIRDINELSVYASAFKGTFHGSKEQTQ